MQSFIKKLQDEPSSIEFEDTMAVIDQYYNFEPSAFSNGVLSNAAGENSGSCKLFAFARLQRLSESETLNCFGRYFRADVMGNPEGSDHQNIRNFMHTGWAGISFEAMPLAAKD